MKKYLIILLLLIAAVFIYININRNKDIPQMTRIEKNKSEIGDKSNTEINEDQSPPEIPEFYDLSTLTIDSKLKPVKLNFPDSVKVPKQEIEISAIIPPTNKLCDLFLLINKKKKDMYYQVNSGTYKFNNIKLIQGKNLLEVFYKIGKKRSPSTSSIIIRE